MPRAGSDGLTRSDTGRLAVLTGVALVARLLTANSGLWIDEIYSLVDSFRLPLVDIITTYRHDNHHPLYSVLARLSLTAFGESAWAIRLPSVLFGAASVPLLYLLGREVAGRREAWFAAILLAVSYHHVWFSQNARGYVMLAWFAMAATWCLLRLLATGRIGYAAGYGAVAALGAYTHLTMVFVAVGQAMAVTLHLVMASSADQRARGWRPAALAFVLAAGGTLLLYAPALGELVGHFLHRPSRLVGVSTPAWAFIESLRVLAQGFGGGVLVVGGGVVAAGAVIFLTGVASYARQSVLILGLFVLPGVAILGGALVARGTMYPRFFFALVGFALLIAVRGIVVLTATLAARTGASATRGESISTAVLGVLALLSLASLGVNYRYPKQDFTGAVTHVVRSQRPGDATATVGVASFAIRDYLGRDWLTLESTTALAALRRERPVWLAWTFPRYLAQEMPGALAVLERDCTESTVFRGTIGGGDIHVCRLGVAP